MAENKDFISTRQKVSFVDLFAGAGGISEGFLQAYDDSKYYDFLLASDINSNCELTHKVRYNHQLGLSTKFICQDIMDDSFVPNLLEALGNAKIDVVTGGPSCQSFSLAGNRKKFDKRDDLFFHYLKVIKVLRPKYFVMENVKGILTKDGGKIAERILKEIRSILDEWQIPELVQFLKSNLNKFYSPYLSSILLYKIQWESEDHISERFKDLYIELLEEQLKKITRDMDYRISKSDPAVATVRHGLKLLRETRRRADLRKSIIELKTRCNVNNDSFTEPLNSFIASLDEDSLVEKITIALDQCKKELTKTDILDEFALSLKIFAMTFDEVIELIREKFKIDKKLSCWFDGIMDKVRLYRIEKPIIVSSANYGVPQDRERVLFIGSMRDQEPITDIPPTISDDEKVKVVEALWDLNTIGNGEIQTSYKKAVLPSKFDNMLISRTSFSMPSPNGKLYSEWSRIGRLTHRFAFDTKPFYVKNSDELNHHKSHQIMELFNHQISSQNEDVRRRLQIIAESGAYDEETKSRLKEEGLKSNKRNYTVLNPEAQSPTVCTMPDDFIHYAAFRPLSVREMARLQSFDDTFVFQGKRQTGGDKRKEEIPQYTLVGNAVPPLMARAIANVILSKIKL